MSRNPQYRSRDLERAQDLGNVRLVRDLATPLQPHGMANLEGRTITGPRLHGERIRYDSFDDHIVITLEIGSVTVHETVLRNHCLMCHMLWNLAQEHCRLVYCDALRYLRMLHVMHCTDCLTVAMTMITIMAATLVVALRITTRAAVSGTPSPGPKKTFIHGLLGV